VPDQFPSDYPAPPVSAEWLDLVISAARMGSYDWDLKSDVVRVSDRAAVILGIEPGTIPADGGETLMRFVQAEDYQHVRHVVGPAVQAGRPYEVEHRVPHGEGAAGWVLSAGTPLRGADGRVERVIGVLQDITDRKTADAQRETLVAELDHRVKNVLASVQSLALQSARKAPSLDTFLKTFAGRLKAMASAHTLLTATRWRGASVHHIAAAELGGLSSGQTRWEGPEVFLTPRATNALALALHELATNAVKFGALSTDDGQVDLRWRLEPDGGLVFEWAESGGPLPGTPSHEGFGATLLNKVTGRELGGEARLEFLATGVRAVLTAAPSALLPPPEAPAEETPAAPSQETTVGASIGDETGAHAAKVGGLRVLIVEDALLLSLELCEGLTEAGVEVVGQAADVGEAMGMLLATEIDAAVLDANLNGQSVAPVAAALAARGTPFIFATGYGDNQQAPQGFSAPFIRKPYDVTQVAAALAEVTGRA
jgi:PAS domain S-box-containing protein